MIFCVSFVFIKSKPCLISLWDMSTSLCGAYLHTPCGHAPCAGHVHMPSSNHHLVECVESMKFIRGWSRELKRYTVNSYLHNSI